MGRVKERLQYMSYLKAMEMVYRGVFVDYSEYEWMIYGMVQHENGFRIIIKTWIAHHLYGDNLQ